MHDDTSLCSEALQNTAASAWQKTLYEHTTAAAAAAVRTPEDLLATAGQARQQVLLHQAVRQAI
jgi:hypothetical protein